MKRKVLITGVSGFLGKHLIVYLLKHTDWQIIGQYRNKKPLLPVDFQERISFFQAKMDHREQFAKIFVQHQPDTIIHLAAMARFDDGQSNPEEAILTNFFGSINLMQQAMKNHVKHFIFTSSDLARNARSAVGISKLLIEYFIVMHQNSQMKSMALRLPNIYDSPATVFDIFKRQIANNEDLTITDPGMARRFLTVDESCTFLHKLILEGKRQSVYAIDQKPLFIKDLADIMIRNSGKSLKIKFIGAKAGEKLYEDSYDKDEIAEYLNEKLIRLKTALPKAEEINRLASLLQVNQSLIKNIEAVFQTLKR